MINQHTIGKGLIENDFLRQFASGYTRSERQINGLLESDAELIRLNKDLVLAITTDNIVEEIHQGLYDDPEQIGWMSVIINLSDLSAVGARPLGILSNITIPIDTDTEFLSRIGNGISKACNKYGINVFGGDTNTGEEFQIGAVGVGLINTPGRIITRKGIENGDLLFTSNQLGSGGYYALSKSFDDYISSTQEFYPDARIDQGEIIRKFGSSCIDTSDGFFAAASNLMEVNSIGFQLSLELDQLVEVSIRESLKTIQTPPWYMLAGPHGEFELIFTVNGKKMKEFLDAAKAIDWSPILIGEAITDPFIFFQIKGRHLKCKPEEIANLYNLCEGDVHQYIQELHAIHKSWNH